MSTCKPKNRFSTSFVVKKTKGGDKMTTITVTDLTKGIDLDKVGTIQWGSPVATANAFNDIFRDTKCEAPIEPTEDEIKKLQTVFDLIMEESESLPWLDLLCVAFGTEETSFEEDDPCASYLRDTPATMIQFDYNNLLIEIRRLYLQLA